MLPLLLLPLLWGGSLQEDDGYALQVPEVVTVQEGLCVAVPCTFSYPWWVWNDHVLLYIYWFRSEDNAFYSRSVATNNPNREVWPETQGRFLLLGNLKENNCSLGIRDARKSDTSTYFLRVERGKNVKYSYRDKKLNLQVTDLTQKPEIHIPEPLESGRPTNLTCRLPGSCEGGRPLIFSWTGDTLGRLDPRTLQSSVLTITPRPQDHGTYLTCQVSLRGSQLTTEKTIQLQVSRNLLYCHGSNTGEGGSGPLIRTLVRGSLMGTGFLLTYVLTWLYYTRCGGLREAGLT
ncbi:PREDICTED: sialic acid-binding Ig-like lectin 14-like [Elephantulus edwardii]|uniref:sialic acid-binding Ig-like lectin 14-like n=1 Tax=Elephantulus edwardii TaxID=28737 RepID=UPI0003F06994|nr:PREDICTED: sialic acid-binding Ig-like lectin 14-like [Elephantulus edwardii]